MPNPTNRTETDREHQRADSEGMAPKKSPTEPMPAQKEVGVPQATKPQATKPQEPTKDASAKPEEGERSRAAAEQRSK